MKEHYELPDEDCEPLKRSEKNAMEMLLVLLSETRYATKDLENRLECIPSGMMRMKCALGNLQSIVLDIIGTINDKQRQALLNVSNDREIRLVPKLTPAVYKMILPKEDAIEFAKHAQVGGCMSCILDKDECRNCHFYKQLTAYVPLEDYRSESCPYANADWSDD